MKLRLLPYILSGLLVFCTLAACNSEEEDVELEELRYTNVAVNRFSLKLNDSVLAHLDTVFFAVDLQNRRIFNPDSLPLGTADVRAQVNISLPTMSEAVLYFNTAKGNDSINYLTNSTDTVDFSHGPVRLHLVSYDRQNQADYTIEVNVHKMQPDSLWWNATATRNLPTTLSRIGRQRTFEWQGMVCCLTYYDGESCLATSTEPSAQWQTRKAALPANAIVSTLTPCGEQLYILDNSNMLYKSDDVLTWTATGVHMSHIYGAYAGQLLGTVPRADGYVVMLYPSATDVATAPLMPEEAPVSGTSNPYVYTTDWSPAPMFTVIGGKKADGSPIGGCWSYDGNQWACTSIEDGPARSGALLFPYFTFRTSSYWIVTRRSILLSFGGINATGKCDNTMYMSMDNGVHWTNAGSLLQPPHYLPAVYEADVVIRNLTLTDRSGGEEWTGMADTRLPGWLRTERPVINRSADPNTSDTLITEWDCPYIYMFGGRYSSGSTDNRVWRGAINRLTFRPLQ